MPRDPARAPLWLVGLVAALLVALPIRAALGLGEVGGYRMFTRMRRTHLVLDAQRADGTSERVAPEQLSPHLGPDARRIVTRAMGTGALGDTAEGALLAALPELARWACQSDASRREVSASLGIVLPDASIERHTFTLTCSKAR